MDIGMLGVILGLACIGVPFLCLYLFPTLNTDRGLHVVFVLVFFGCTLTMLSAYAENIVHRSPWLLACVFALLAVAGIWVLQSLKKNPEKKDEKKKED